ncbi:hypothetical protein WOLCODRAFT_28398 [Wolfiporia cocos MD-104 SS10]|uniref:Uncharacterized protein n=1 Tax=Wolfiporia cocos (strain MD-104) TaxID=742152 RepID=A0A2H3J1X1_WOLCO|nr:hypothetical protein WOLCODRAFT_28398 [Wolfiporia cocos MD-104 SS10]
MASQTLMYSERIGARAEPEARSAAQAARGKMSTTSGDARQDAAGGKGTLQRVKRAEESRVETHRARPRSQALQTQR